VKTFRLAIAVWFLSCAIHVARAQTAASDGSLTASPVYQKNCAKCHGKTAEGRHFGGPPLVSEKTTHRPTGLSHASFSLSSGLTMDTVNNNQVSVSSCPEK
jgi:mono/diheme cytochrome c family protein